jgi:N-acyl-phosphatidylethanolamine-hydrolysing phospholipase D
VVYTRIVPVGVKEILAPMGVTNVVELDWWQSHSIAPTAAFVQSKPIEVIFTPTKHWTSRTPFDKNTSLWGSFAVLAPECRFFFAGDTAYCDVFKLIGQKYGPFDLAAIPVGAYLPRWFMKDVHCDPSESVQIHKDLQAKQSVAVHWGTFPLADEHIVEPALELARAREEQLVPTNEFYTMAHGETLNVGDAPKHDFASRHHELYAAYLATHSSAGKSAK